jgi:hypothetical protein
MPDHLNQRIAQLRELVRQGLHEENLDRAVRECGSLAQDSRQVLVFFTLKNVFKELSQALEAGAIAVTRHQELVEGISGKILSLLEKVASDAPMPLEEIEELVRTHVVNRNLFNS